jgi:hypothetical protein
MKPKPCGPVEAFKPAVVWRASQCGWLRIGKTQHGHDVWEKPNGQQMVIRAGAEPLVPVRRKRAQVSLTCNIWWSLTGANVRLSEEDLRAFHQLRRDE